MRKVERIPIITKFFKENIDKLKEFIKPDEPWIDLNEIISAMETNWIKLPDLRLGQFLINECLIPDSSIWYIEEDDWLINKGYFKFEEIKFWGKNFDKEDNKLPKTEWILLKDITDDHVKGILEYVKNGNGINPQYLEYFKSRQT